MKHLKTFEGFGYSDDDYQSEVISILKKFNLRPVEINNLMDFYAEMMVEYEDNGKVPQVFVNDIKDNIGLGQGGYSTIVMPPKTNTSIKNL
jgi:glutaredoxin